METVTVTNYIKKALESAYEEGFDDGATKQAILELQGRDRFLEELKGKQKTPLTKEQIQGLNEKYGYFQFADAQGAVTLAFVRDIEKAHGIS